MAAFMHLSPGSRPFQTHLDPVVGLCLDGLRADLSRIDKGVGTDPGRRFHPSDVDHQMEHGLANAGLLWISQSNSRCAVVP